MKKKKKKKKKEEEEEEEEEEEKMKTKKKKTQLEGRIFFGRSKTDQMKLTCRCCQTGALRMLLGPKQD